MALFNSVNILLLLNAFLKCNTKRLESKMPFQSRNLWINVGKIQETKTSGLLVYIGSWDLVPKQMCVLLRVLTMK